MLCLDLSFVTGQISLIVTKTKAMDYLHVSEDI